MGWGSLNSAQFEDRLSKVRQLIQVHGPEDVAQQLHAAVARSTAPLESLQGKKPLEVRLRGRTAGVQAGSEQGGVYKRAGIFGRPPRIDLSVHEDTDPEHMEMSLFHELGHHASRLAGTASYRTARQRGAEEARADDFAHQHHVRDPEYRGEDTRHQHAYEHAGLTPGVALDPMGLGGSEKFNAAYQAQRRVRIEPTTRWGHFDTGRGI